MLEEGTKSWKKGQRQKIDCFWKICYGYHEERTMVCVFGYGLKKRKMMRLWCTIVCKLLKLGSKMGLEDEKGWIL